VRLGTDFISKARAKPDTNAEIVSEYIRTAFLSNLTEPRSLDECADEYAVVLMDILGLLRDAAVRVITWAPHMTQIFQQVDVSLFGVLKRLVPKG
jgi:hypothetical protein